MLGFRPVVILKFHCLGLDLGLDLCIKSIDLMHQLTSSRRHVGGQSHCLVRACATGTFLTTAFKHNPIDPQAAAQFCFFDGVTSYAYGLLDFHFVPGLDLGISGLEPNTGEHATKSGPCFKKSYD